MTEKTMRNRVTEQLKKRGMDICNHEDGVNLGVPDQSYGVDGVEGWVELKHEDKWPVRADTIARMKRYTDAQRFWILNRGKAGGRCFLLLQVGTDWLLFGHMGAQLVGKVDRATLESICLMKWESICFDSLLVYLKGSSDDEHIIRRVYNFD